MTFQNPPASVSALLIALVIIAGIFDIRYRRIPNWLSLSGVVAGVGLNAFLYQGWPGLRLSLTGLGVGFGAYFLLYLLRAMGAGDVKLMAAIGAMAGLQDWFGIFMITAVIGGIAGLALAGMRGRLRKTIWNMGFILNEMKSGRPAYLGNKELDVRNPQSVGLPHGAVISIATIVFLGISFHFSR